MDELGIGSNKNSGKRAASLLSGKILRPSRYVQTTVISDIKRDRPLIA